MFAYRLPLSPEARRRAGGIVIALLIELVILLALLSLGVVPGLRKVETQLSTFNVLPDGKTDAKTQKQRKTEAAKRTPLKTPPPPPSAAPPPPIRNPHTLTAPPGLLVLDKEQYAKSDIGKIKGTGTETADAGADGGKDSGTAYGPGQGPGGQPLYYAEWYREPTRAEMSTYLPANLRSGSALIACKTIENYHVENCQSLGETPPGSGLARAMRLASWQFLVRPPRRGGKVLIGSWVRIRYDIIPVGGDGAASDAPDQ